MQDSLDALHDDFEDLMQKVDAILVGLARSRQSLPILLPVESAHSTMHQWREDKARSYQEAQACVERMEPGNELAPIAQALRAAPFAWLRASKWSPSFHPSRQATPSPTKTMIGRVPSRSGRVRWLGAKVA